ncbi:MAG: TetR/AcrR family transcriptional regulator [Clostridia bacterium]|nr:TetR/AcrR family transcriptional regulator [Clostridia bacterium]
MARINRKELTKLELVRHATQSFLEHGYTNSSVKTLCKELDMSPGVLTFHFPTKEHLLAELVNLLCDFQWKMMEDEAKEGLSSIMALCLELATMVATCEEDEIARDFYLSAYSSIMCLDIIRKNDTERAKRVFATYCPDWTHEQYVEAIIIVLGIEFSTLMSSDSTVSTDTKISGALNTILTNFNVPEDLRKSKIERVLAMDYRSIGRRVLMEFKKYVQESNEQALMKLMKG